MRLKWTRPAASDLENIEVYIAEDNSPNVAIDVVLRIIEQIELVLPAHPGAGRIGRVPDTRELAVDGLPYLVIYRDRADEIQILRVLHNAQQWPQGE